MRLEPDRGSADGSAARLGKLLFDFEQYVPNAYTFRGIAPSIFISNIDGRIRTEYGTQNAFA